MLSYDDIKDQLERRVEDARVTLEEIEESGDLEDRMEAAFRLEEAERDLFTFTHSRAKSRYREG